MTSEGAQGAAAPSGNDGGGARKIRRQTTAEIASKALKDNFKGWTEEYTHVRKIEGRSLFERLCHDLERKQQERIVMGGKYYRMLKDLYRPPTDM